MAEYCPTCHGGGRSQRFFIDDTEPNCLSCQTLAKTLRYFYSSRGPRGRVRLMPGHFDDGAPLVQVAGTDDDDQPAGFTYYVRTAKDAQLVNQLVGNFFANLPIARDIEAVPSGKHTLGQILAWDTKCQQSHPKCQRQIPRLPSRVLDVRIVDGKCRLHLSHGTRDNYMTLSHCWGKLPILTTLSSNIDTHLHGIELQSLPKTFQDAIQLSARLGIRYLWIDSLCIVQDDADDWAKESSMMAAIYSNSYLTLAATSAKDGSEGLFKPRNTEIYSNRIINPSNAAESATICCMTRRKHDCFRGVDQDREDLDETALPLMTRAWVFQERLLSPRLLHFASDELVWECQETTECECGYVPDYRQFEINKGKHGDRLAPDTPDRILFQELVKEKHWYRLVRSYTRLDITKDNDRLPAFSGIASTLIDPRQYLAGLRRNYLLGDLLWSTGLQLQAKRPGSFQAPSWSWASVMAPIIHPSTSPFAWGTDEKEALAQVLEASATPSSQDPFGRVSGGELRIKGHYFTGIAVEKDRSELIGSTFGSHCLRLEVTNLPKSMWPLEVSYDTAQDAREAIGSPVTLLAIRSEGDRIHFLLLDAHPSDPQKMQRRGITTVLLIVRMDGKVDRVPIQDILDRAKSKEFVIV
ncbi:hypothetical protein HJFPF1_10842 [Paramyrothecium foliicola]|nr:hypothetical protein HJFPF1_10842 [Paramyrothecium foliicola]